jgi:predicted metal-dependent HD superfamily phosphohydrolase
MLFSKAVMHGLRMRYGEAHRRYHVWSHIETLLKLKAWCADDVFNHQAVELAIYFHDAIYEPGEDDNEKRSADLMRAVLEKEAAPVNLEVARALILATATHEVPETLEKPVKSDCAVFLDMDLAVLGAAPDVFDAYEAAIREEFIALSDTQWASGRRKFLLAMLDRKTIYLTPRFRNTYEQQAQDNLENALKLLP